MVKIKAVILFILCIDSIMLKIILHMLNKLRKYFVSTIVSTIAV